MPATVVARSAQIAAAVQRLYALVFWGRVAKPLKAKRAVRRFRQWWL